VKDFRASSALIILKLCTLVDVAEESKQRNNDDKGYDAENDSGRQGEVGSVWLSHIESIASLNFDFSRHRNLDVHELGAGLALAC
jgi:hypothetical protein